MKVLPFRVSVDPASVADLRLRLERTRWPGRFHAHPWDYGVPHDELHSVVRFWQNDYDWSTAEASINRFAHFRAEIDGARIHFVHVKGKRPGSVPLVLTHGWPGSFIEMLPLIPLLTDPLANGINSGASFDVVVPSLPGFGFSDAPSRPGMNTKAIAALWHKLMAGLGYKRYYSQGGDIGAGVSTWLARLFPEAVMGVHLNFIPGSFQPSLSHTDPPLSDDEKRWLMQRQDWLAREGGYSHQQSTKPDTLGYALNDSPVGLAAWMLEKFYAWSDGQGDLLARFDPSDLLTNVCVYWFRGNVTSSLRLYRENAGSPLSFATGERIAPPLSFAHFPKEIIVPPRMWVERVFNVKRWTKMVSGGHFAALEAPSALARDIHDAFATQL